MAQTDAQKRAQARYNRQSTRQVPIRLNVHTDADILAKLDSVDSKAGYVKRLIRADIAENG